MNRAEARDACNAMEAHLAIIKTEMENDAIKDYLFGKSFEGKNYFTGYLGSRGPEC